MRSRVYGVLTAGTVYALASTFALAADPGPTCESSKLGTTAKYAQCRLKADAKAAKTGDAADYTKCDLDKFTDAETKAGGACPSSSDQTDIGNFVDACTSSVAVALGGGGLLLDVVTCNADLSTCNTDLDTCSTDLSTCNADLVSCQAATCGNGTAEFGETCDGSDLDGKTCATEAPSTPYGSLACNGTCDGFDTSGCKGRFTDNGDGTVTDNSTKLMWEKKTTDVGSGTDFSNPNDVDNRYNWTVGTTAPNGKAFTDFLDKLNGQAGVGTGFAGHYDWRLPTVEELQGIVDLSIPGCGSSTMPCIDAVFGPTQSDFYWSSSTYPSFVTYAWVVYFVDGYTFGDGKANNLYVRAVRAVP